MKKWFLLAASAVTVASVSWGASLPVCGARLGDLTPTTLQDYINDYNSLGGCTIADKTFSSFTYGAAASGGAGLITAGGITIIPDPSNPLDPGLIFEASWGVASVGGVAESQDSQIGFQVTVTDGSKRIEDDTLTVPLYSASGTGAVTTITEGVCLGGSFIALQCTGGTLQVPQLKIPCTAQTGSTCTQNNTDMNVGPFGPYATLGVLKDINLNSGTAGAASFSEVGQYFSQVPVPEPTGILLLGTCLLLVAPVLKRRLG
jgi:hypothetical protein